MDKANQRNSGGREIMGGRYFITGIQLGMIEALAEKNPKQVLDLIKEIEDKQYICDKEEFDKMIKQHKEKNEK